MADKLSKSEIKTLIGKIQTEGFDYCFIDYSDWEEIKSNEFQEKLKAFKSARENFVAFLQGQGIELDN